MFITRVIHPTPIGHYSLGNVVTSRPNLTRVRFALGALFLGIPAVSIHFDVI